MNKMKIFWLASLIMIAGLSLAHATVADNNSIDVWWPTDSAHMTNTQPFKTMLPGLAVDQYQMFWQVDGGQWNLMDNNDADFPHKETSVDLTNWSWHGQGPYVVNFIAQSNSGVIIAQQSVNIYNDGQSVPIVTVSKKMFVSNPTQTPVATLSPIPMPASPAPTPTATASATATPTLTPTLTATPVATQSPINGPFYVDPNSAAQQWINSNASSQPDNAKLMAMIASQPAAVWLGDWNSNVYQDAKNVADAAKATNTIPLFVLYNIPHRDCGSYSAGGAKNGSDYRNWINDVANALSNSKALVMLEPDVLASMDCLSSQDQAERTSLIKDAVNTLESHGIKTYIDAGNPHWIDATTMASRLTSAGVASAHGFALNISNFFYTSDNINYGTQLSQKLNGKHFVIDTSRNGSGPTSDNQWCNPSGRSLGIRSTSDTGNSLVDDYLWDKRPGESDGSCNGGPSAGQFWPDYALDLARRTTSY